MAPRTGWRARRQSGPVEHERPMAASPRALLGGAPGGARRDHAPERSARVAGHRQRQEMVHVFPEAGWQGEKACPCPAAWAGRRAVRVGTTLRNACLWWRGLARFVRHTTLRPQWAGKAGSRVSAPPLGRGAGQCASGPRSGMHGDGGGASPAPGNGPRLSRSGLARREAGSLPRRLGGAPGGARRDHPPERMAMVACARTCRPGMRLRQENHIDAAPAVGRVPMPAARLPLRFLPRFRVFRAPWRGRHPARAQLPLPTTRPHSRIPVEIALTSARQTG